MRPITFILNGNTSDFTIKYSPPITLNQNKKYEAALLSLDLYNSFRNITNINNKFKYSTDSRSTWKTIAIDKGSYELTALNDEIQRQMIINNDYDSVNNTFYITITANILRLTSIVEITNPIYHIDFNVPSSIGQTLGFPINSPIIERGFNESPNIVDIMKINSILVNIDIISGSYVNGSQSPAIYSFFPNDSPGRKIVD